MKIDLLLTEEMKATMPKSINILHNFGEITVRFPSIESSDEPMFMDGESVIIEAETQEIINWLKPFDGVPIGCGTPQLEQFMIKHIKDNL